MGGATTLKNDSHVRMDLFYERLSERGKAWMNLVTILCLMFYLGVMLFGSISSLDYAIATNERRFSMWNPPMAPINSRFSSTGAEAAAAKRPVAFSTPESSAASEMKRM
ncbi:TRAP transporter small permease subunit [Rhodosalinus sp.]|uniref:TRAP transporter small permease subunit n=1 Tax=Rhodosalinus sp. TaxID=2047741 RepID=UPI00397CC5B8